MLEELPPDKQDNNAAPAQEQPAQEQSTPQVDLVQLANLEKKLAERLEQQTEGKKLEAQADAEMAEIKDQGASMSLEQVFLIIAAAIMVVSLPFMHFLLATILALFTVALAVIAGLSSPKQSFGPTINLTVSLIGLLLFEYSAIIIHTAAGITGAFMFYQFLAFLFLFATFFSARTYRKKLFGRELE